MNFKNKNDFFDFVNQKAKAKVHFQKEVIETVRQYCKPYLKLNAARIHEDTYSSADSDDPAKFVADHLWPLVDYVNLVRKNQQQEQK